MAGFYIKKVIAKSDTKPTSFVEFTEGLNIIQGRSDTGKSCIVKCIEFVFGGDMKHLKTPFKESSGFNEAVVVLGVLPAFNEDDAEQNELFIIRRLLENSDYTTISIKKEKKRIVITAENFPSDSEDRIIATKILTPKKESNSFDCLSFSVFKAAWNGNLSYYQKIIKSYSN